MSREIIATLEFAKSLGELGMCLCETDMEIAKSMINFEKDMRKLQAEHDRIMARRKEFEPQWNALCEKLEIQRRERELNKILKGRLKNYEDVL